MTDAAVFEALFLRGGDVPPGLRAALLGVGVDLDALAPRYPSSTWTAAVDLARSYLAPGAGSIAAAERELGRRCTAGYLTTVTGRLLAEALPVMTFESVLARLGRYVRMGRDDIVVDVVESGPGRARLIVTDTQATRPWFFVGLVEAGLELLDTPFQVSLEPLSGLQFALVVTWAR
jgi:uncharacterized protein (TIGR02265 family)